MKAALARFVISNLTRKANARGEVRLARLLNPLVAGAILPTPYGPRVEVDLRDSMLWLAFHNYLGTVPSYINALLKPGDAFIDVGSNVGVLACLAGQIVGDQGLVLAFEPSFREFSRLLRNVEINFLTKRVYCFNVALSDRAGLSNFIQEGIEVSGRSRLAFDTGSSNSRCMTQTLDALCPPEVIGSRNTMIKIDTEGAELLVLKGAPRLLEQGHLKHIIVEMHADYIEKSGAQKSDVYDLMAATGFMAMTEHRRDGTAQYDELFSRPNI